MKATTKATISLILLEHFCFHSSEHVASYSKYFSFIVTEQYLHAFRKKLDKAALARPLIMGVY
jgi:hypothetical protein